MSESLTNFLQRLKNQPESIAFEQSMAVIVENYDYTPTTFRNGDDASMAVNEAGTNEGSCKIFAFAQQQKLSQELTLALFGRFYREDVLQHPTSTDHANIRHFIRCSWSGIAFDGVALLAK